jgi:radical SAM superfamily enzyme YgiQ (UPF0313 family)
MMGLPTETYEDLDGIADLANKILDEYYKIPKNERASGINITVSASVFVPKPFTPFQWVRQNTKEEVIEKLDKFHIGDVVNVSPNRLNPDPALGVINARTRR